MKDTKTRRAFFQFTIVGILITPLALFGSKGSQASDACPVNAPAGKKVALPNEGMGKTLDYVVDASTSKNVKYKAGNNCANCKFYNTAKLEAGYAPCTMLGMKYVAGCGWCKTYLVKA